MSPDDLLIVNRTWAALRPRQAELRDALTAVFGHTAPEPVDPAVRAAWLLGAVETLVDLLAVPSRLAAASADVGATWPNPGTAPTFAVDGRAWLDAAAACLPDWTGVAADAWKQAWLLLAEELAAESLSPFRAPGTTPGEPAHPHLRGDHP